jgi:SurA N-terminal domain
VVLVAVLAMFAFTACSSGGAAATVGDDEISIAEVQNDLLELRQEYGAEAVTESADAQRNIIIHRVRGVLLEDLAEEHDVQVSGAEIDSFLETVGTSSELSELREQNLLTPELLRLAARNQLLATKLAQKLGGEEQLSAAVEERSQELGVTVNRRYGTWNGLSIDAGTGSIASEPFNSNG